MGEEEKSFPADPKEQIKNIVECNPNKEHEQKNVSRHVTEGKKNIVGNHGKNAQSSTNKVNETKKVKNMNFVGSTKLLRSASAPSSSQGGNVSIRFSGVIHQPVFMREFSGKVSNGMLTWKQAALLRSL